MVRKVLLASIAMALSMTTGALAQEAGSYAGTSADNNTISLTVTETSGVFTVTSMSVGFTANCALQGNIGQRRLGVLSGSGPHKWRRRLCLAQ